MLHIRTYLTAISLFVGTSLLAAEEKTLTLAGSTTVLPIAQRVAEEFMNLHPDVNISVRGGGSGVGIAALIDGVVDIANASHPMKDEELKLARERGVNPVPTIIANDGIAVIVHPENPIDEISLDQLKAIYTGGISRWSELGGTNRPIVVISRDVASGTFEVFKKLVLEGENVRPDAIRLASNKAVAVTVAKTPDAIGYVGLGFLSPEVKPLKVDGVSPTPENVISGKYKIVRPLYMYTNGEPKGLAKEFIQFILSDEGQNLVKELGFIPVRLPK